MQRMQAREVGGATKRVLDVITRSEEAWIFSVASQVPINLDRDQLPFFVSFQPPSYKGEVRYVRLLLVSVHLRQ